jgi:hypothetical protein
VGEPKTELEAGESVVKEARANMRRGAEHVGGRLFLTDRRLIFESHALNVQRGTTEIPTAGISELRKAWTRFLGAMPLAPTTLVVTDREGTEHEFVVRGRPEWIGEIERVRVAHRLE